MSGRIDCLFLAVIVALTLTNVSLVISNVASVCFTKHALVLLLTLVDAMSSITYTFAVMYKYWDCRILRIFTKSVYEG